MAFDPDEFAPPKPRASGAFDPDEFAPPKPAAPMVARQYGGSTSANPPPGPWSPNTLADPSPMQREADFQKWYADGVKEKEKKFGFKLNPNPDDPGHFYNHRALFRDIQANGGEAMDAKTGHGDSSYKLPGHPRTYLRDSSGKIFDTRTMKYTDGSQVPDDRANADLPDLPRNEWPDQTPPAAKAPPAAPPREPVGMGETIARFALDGATLGHADEASAAIEAGLGKVGLGPDRSYTELRDEKRARREEARADHPIAAPLAELGGSLATAGVGGVGGGAAKVIGRGIATGAAYGEGASDADLTKGEVVPLLKDAGKGALIGGAIGAAGEGAKAIVKKAGSVVSEGLQRRIENEIAEGDGFVKTTPTGRKQIARAGKNIFQEVVHNDDATAVRKAFQSDPKKGLERLQPVIDKVGEANKRAYSAIEGAGRDVVDMATYQKHLDALRTAAVKGGNSLVADSLKAFQAKILEQQSQAGGVMTLRQLRGLTTEAGTIAASAMGGLAGNLPAEVKSTISRAAQGAMDASLSRAVKGDAALEKAAESIRANNKRMNALLTIGKQMELRSAKSETGRSLLVRAAEKMSNPVAFAGGSAAIYGLGSGKSLDDKAERAALGLLVMGGSRLLPAGARALDRGITTLGIRAAQGGGGLPGKGIERAARAVGRVGAGAAVAKVPKYDLSGKKVGEEADDAGWAPLPADEEEAGWAK